MLVRELMSSPAVTITPEARVKDALILLDERCITSIPVVDDTGELVGVVSEANLIEDIVLPDERRHLIPVRMDGPPRHQRVADVMTHHVMEINVDADVADAVELMTKTMVKSLPVTEKGKVVGMLSRRDIVRALATRDEAIEASIDDLARESGHEWLIEVTDGVVEISGLHDAAEEKMARGLAGSVAGVVAVHIDSARER